MQIHFPLDSRTTQCAVGFLNEQSYCFTCLENNLIICTVKDGDIMICICGMRLLYISQKDEKVHVLA